MPHPAPRLAPVTTATLPCNDPAGWRSDESMNLDSISIAIGLEGGGGRLVLSLPLVLVGICSFWSIHAPSGRHPWRPQVKQDRCHYGAILNLLIPGTHRLTYRPHSVKGLTRCCSGGL